MNTRERRLLAHFADEKDVRLYRSPGRANLIGEHTDYSGGLVLPTTTGVYTWIAATPRDDRKIKTRSLTLGESQTIDLNQPHARRNSGWGNYIEGVARLLEQAGVALGGANLIIDSDIPIGGGLSSSAALELCTAVALLDFADANLSPRQLALLCQQAEIDYAGVKCGVMDQFAVACCPSSSAMLLDCRSLEFEAVSLPDNVRFLITDSGVKHALADSGYNDRAAECAAATELLAKQRASFHSLRDIDSEDLRDCRSVLSNTLYRRCRHIVGENQRVLSMCSALKASDRDFLGSLVSESHQSLKADYEVSCKEVDQIVDTANDLHGVLGSRMIGGGFGGCVLSVVESGLIDNVKHELGQILNSRLGKQPWMHVVTPAEPAGRVLTT